MKMCFVLFFKFKIGSGFLDFNSKVPKTTLAQILTFGIYFSPQRQCKHVGFRFLYNTLKQTICSLVRVNSHYKTNYPRKAKTLEHNLLDVCQISGHSILQNHLLWRRLESPQKTNAYAHRNLHNTWPSSPFKLQPLLSKET